MYCATTFPARAVRGFTLALLIVLLLPLASLAQDVTFGPGLLDTLEGMSPADELTVVVTFEGEGPLTTEQVAAVEALGVSRGISFRALPVMGVAATPEQVHALAGVDGVRSVWPNSRLTYFNEGSRDVTGVERLRTDDRLRTADGMPFSGRGVTVMINDSGVDGTHADLEYPSHLVENVQALTNLNAVTTLAPVTYVEGQPNTDTNSGHGTHCAGTVGGTGERSGGKYAGVAPGADLVGYGSGGVLFILDALGGFDYAVTHQFAFEHPLRVISNSWGSSGTFDPNDPVVVASYAAYQRGINVVFAAGNSGPGEDTHNPYAVAPWVISVGAGEKDGSLAGFSSRGKDGQTFTFTTDDGKQWTAVNEPSVVAPGVDVISTRAATNGSANGGDADLEAIEPAYLPFYTMISGTSMATPHVAGIVALLLEANPALQPAEVKALLQRTATNMPGREAWEAGSGYVNAYAAAVEATGLRDDFGQTVNVDCTFDSNALTAPAGSDDFSLFFTPVGTPDTMSFEVGADISLVKARAVVPDNTVALVLIAPDGSRYGSSITLPLLGEIAAVSAPGQPGTWKLTVAGIGSISGVPVDPLGVTNGTAAPGTVAGTLSFVRTSGFSGLDDIAGHPAEGAIQYAVRERLVDGISNGRYRPDAPLRRAHLAEFLVMGAGTRQFLPLETTTTFDDVSGTLVPFVEAVAARGAALKDRTQNDGGVMRVEGSSFRPSHRVDRAELAYSLVQSLGFEDVAQGYDGQVVVSYGGERLPIEDSDVIPADLRGYVQLALDAGLLNAYFALEQGPYDLQPTLKATFRPDEDVTRADYAVAATRLFDVYPSADPSQYNNTSDGTSSGTLSMATTASGPEARDADAAPHTFALETNYPNPFNPSTQIAFTLAEETRVRLAVYDVLGRQVRVLVDGEAMAAGAHQVQFEAGNLPSGTYLYRIETPGFTDTHTMVLAK